MTLTPSLVSFRLVLAASALLVSAHRSQAQDAKPAKTFIDYFLPTRINSPLSKDAWGAVAVGPRDQGNGLEDVTMKQRYGGLHVGSWTPQFFPPRA